MMKGIERLKFARLTLLGIVRHYGIDRVNLHRHLPANIRHHMVFMLFTIQSNRLRQIVKEIDYRRTSQSEGVRVYQSPQGADILQVNMDLKSCLKTSSRGLIETAQIKEEELLRQGEILGEQPEPREAARRPGQER